MLPLQLHQALSSKRSVLFSLRQCGNSVFAQCLMKPECLEISCFFPSFSLSFSNLGLHVDMKRGFLVILQQPSLQKHFHLAPAPASLCGVQHHKETPAPDIFLPTATYLWIHLYILRSCFYCKKGTLTWNEVSLADKIEVYCPML